jgi:hypothetical protein
MVYDNMIAIYVCVIVIAFFDFTQLCAINNSIGITYYSILYILSPYNWDNLWYSLSKSYVYGLYSSKWNPLFNSGAAQKVSTRQLKAQIKAE